MPHTLQKPVPWSRPVELLEAAGGMVGGAGVIKRKCQPAPQRRPKTFAAGAQSAKHRGYGYG